MTNARKVSLKKALRVIIIITLIFILLSFSVTKIIYDAIFSRWDPEKSALSSELSALEESAEKYTFYSDGTLLSSYLYTADASPADSLVVIVPGFRSTHRDYLAVAESFRSAGRDVFIFDPTGCGDSGGESCVGFAGELFDLDAALDFIDGNFNYSHIFLLGHSRGGWAACCVLADGEHRISAVAAVSAVNSPMESIIMPAESRIGFAAYLNYPMLLLYQSMLFGPSHADNSAAEALSETEIPVLIVHAENDEQVPADRYSLISHRAEIESDSVEYYICDDPDGDGHTGVLFSADGSADETLMTKIDTFFSDAAESGDKTAERTDIHANDGRNRTDTGVYAG